MAGILGDFDRSGESPLRGFGLTVSEMRAVARRQLAGSVVVAIFVLAIAAVLGIRSNQVSEPRYETAHSGTRGTRQPIFVTPSDRVIAAVKHKIGGP